jgi:hypothetical protein
VALTETSPYFPMLNLPLLAADISHAPPTNAVSCFEQTGTHKRCTQTLDRGVLVHAMQGEGVHRANIAEFRRLLTKTTDKYQRRTLLRLLVEEEAKGTSAGFSERDPDDVRAQNVVEILPTYPNRCLRGRREGSR